MRAKGLLVTLVAGLAVGCGEGRAIFNVDVYSFFKGTGQDTIRYFIPPGGGSASNTPKRVNLPGAGSSIVDSVKIFGTVDLVNASGSGTIAAQLFLAADSAGTYAPSALAFSVFPKSVSGASTVADTIQGKLNAGASSLFTKSELWFRLVAGGTNSGLTLVQGKMVLTSLQLTVVITDKLFGPAN